MDFFCFLFEKRDKAKENLGNRGIVGNCLAFSQKTLLEKTNLGQFFCHSLPYLPFLITMGFFFQF